MSGLGPFEADAEGNLKSLEVPAALSWCNKNSLYARILFEVDSKGKATKKACCLTKSMLYICDTAGTVDKAIRLKSVHGLFTQQMEVKKSIVSSKAMEHHVLLKIEGNGDILFRLYHDKANTADGNDETLLERAIVYLANREGSPVAITQYDTHDTLLTERADWEQPEGHVDMKVVLEARLREREKQAENAQIGSPAIDSPGQAISDGSAATPPPAAAAAGSGGGGGGGYSGGGGTGYNHDSTLSVLSDKVRQLEGQVAVSASQLATERGKAEKAEANAASLKERLEEEQASREDIVRELRADFDTRFIKKQADEFELRQRQFQRLRDKDQARIKDLEGQVNEPRTYSGPADLMERIRTLEKQLAASEARQDEAECRAIHYQNGCDDHFASLKELSEFVQDGALPRIRDLQAGKDHRKLPLLPRVPPRAKEFAPFVYDPSSKPVRVVAAAPAAAAPAASAGAGSIDLGDDLDLDLGSPAANASIDLGDDLDLDLGGPVKPAGGGGDAIDLDGLL